LQTVKQAGTQKAAEIFRGELSKGLSEGLNPRDIADNIVEQVNKGFGTVTKNRARIVARTEIINAHAQGTLSRFQQAGIQEVQGRSELITASDDRVCPRCLALEGQKFKLREARNIIPVHPMCRCSWIPITGLSQEREQARQFARQRFDRIGMKPEQINPMNPNDSATKEALSRFGKVRRWEKGDRNEEPTFDTFNPATTL
jgi:SPP1 gp7 family putative phage head morphogenesis protein